MNNKRYRKHILICFVLGITLVVPQKFAMGQNQKVNLQIELSPILENAQILSLTGLGIDEKGSGPLLVSGILENLTNQKLENLYFEVSIKAGKIGTIVDLKPRYSRPFSLEPYQSVYATNNDLANERIPGIEETISFDGGLTNPTGEDFINNLVSTSLPTDTYTIKVTVIQVTDEFGRQELASAVAEVGGGGMASSTIVNDIFLKTPGDVAGSDAEITNPYPQFSWEGDQNTTYRLLVVRANGQDSPESLLQSAKSSATLTDGGSLLQFEHADVMVDGTSYQFPPSGVQALERGQQYFWQVSTTLQISGGTEELTSEVWTFWLADNNSGTTITANNQELDEALVELLGQDIYDRFNESGFTLENVEIDGQIYSGPIAVQQLEMLLQKVRDEEIIINHN